MTKEDAVLFHEEMADVKPIQGKARSVLVEKQLDENASRARREAAQANEYMTILTLASACISPVAPDEVVSFKRDGVQDAVFKNLRLGKYACKTELDIHAYTVRQARDGLIQFILMAYRRGERSVLVIHGKGYKSQPFAGLIKSFVCHWLTQMEEVLGFHSANRQRGSTGALYVMLTKSDEKRLETRETNHKGVGFR